MKLITIIILFALLILTGCDSKIVQPTTDAQPAKQVSTAESGVQMPLDLDCDTSCVDKVFLIEF